MTCKYFDCSGLTSVAIPNSITSIGSSAFSGCSSLTSVSIPNSVTSIGNYAFDGCSGLTSVAIPNSVTTIGNYTFYNCSGLTSVAIPNSITSIGSSAFSGCSSLTSVSIPNSVKSIGYNAFRDCKGLTSVDILCKDELDFCNYVQRTDIASVFHQGDLDGKQHAIYIADEEQTDIVIPNSVTSIGSSAFEGCYDITSVTIGEKVKKISNYCFKDCSSLKEVTLGKGLASIGEDAFAGSDRIETIYSLNPIPPTCANESVFDEYVYKAAVVYVPSERNAIARYKGDAVWNKFFEIYEKDMTDGLGDAYDANAGQRTDVYYDMQGRKLNKPNKTDVYIVNGKKVLIKK